MKVREIKCKTAVGKCGFPGGGLAINPYVGCGHGCVYCYARFIKRFTGHTEEWGTFVDIRTNIADVLSKQLKSPKFQGEQIYLSTVTDPYQPLERKYQLTRKILAVLTDFKNPVSIMTKSALVLRDLDILKKLKEVDVNFTLNTLDGQWQSLVEPCSSTVKERLTAMRKLTEAGIAVFALMGPYWPVFTDPKALFKEFRRVGVKRVFTESFNTVGGNWTGARKVLQEKYPELLPKMEPLLFEKDKFIEFYGQAERTVNQMAQEYNLPVTIYFGQGHAAKFK